VDRDQVTAALRAEGETLIGVLAGLGDEQLDRPTPCVPWTVRELLVHVVRASDRLPGMLGDPEPERAEVAAAGYYRPDQRFASEAEAERVAWAQQTAGSVPATEWIRQLADACRTMVAAAEQEPPGRRVRTRWGDTMWLTDFLVTRVLELGVHGLDLAAGLDRPP
jgi:uncharacterized protein (TIGR03083 family)